MRVRVLAPGVTSRDGRPLCSHHTWGRSFCDLLKFIFTINVHCIIPSFTLYLNWNFILKLNLPQTAHIKIFLLSLRQGVLQWLQWWHRSLKLPIMLYNKPRTSCYPLTPRGRGAGAGERELAMCRWPLRTPTHTHWRLTHTYPSSSQILPNHSLSIIYFSLTHIHIILSYPPKVVLLSV